MHIGLVLPPLVGHLNPGSTLGGALKDHRGHRVTLICTPDKKQYAEREGLEFATVGTEEHESGILAADAKLLGSTKSMEMIRGSVKFVQRLITILFRDLPSVLKECDIDALLVDGVLEYVCSFAEANKIPCGVISCALPLLRSPHSLPSVTDFAPTPSIVTNRIRNTMFWFLYNRFLKPLYDQTNKYRLSHGLPPVKPDGHQKNATIWATQLPECLDFPNMDPPPHFFHTNPWQKLKKDQEISFPWDKLDGRPILYVSMGTIVNENKEIFMNVAEACIDIDVQLVVALGKKGATLEGTFPEGTIIADYAPQLQLLERATALVSHAGLNTTLGGIYHGLPIVAVPYGSDQPGVAARLEYLGAAKVVPPGKARKPAPLREAIQLVLTDSSYRESAKRLQKQLREGPTLESIAHLIEFGLQRPSSKPLLRTDPEAIKILMGGES